MKVCSREFKLLFSKKIAGGGGACDCDLQNIILGTDDLQNTRMLFDTLIHEIIESILIIHRKRYQPYYLQNTDETDGWQSNCLFVYNHDDLCQISNDIAEALLTSGFIKLIDPRSQNMNRRKR